MAKIDKKPATARSGAVEIVQQVLGEGAYTNIAVNKFVRTHELSDMDRRLMTELVYGTVKAVGTIDWYLQQCVTRPLDKIDKLVLNILRISVYQLLYMDKIPASAACNEAVNLARQMVMQARPKAIVAVACERDLTSGIQDVFPLPVLGVLNERPYGPCFNTRVDKKKLEDAILAFLDNEEANGKN